MSDPTRPQGSHKIRRRNRMITSCLECRRRKLKCDKAHPCVNCKKTSRDCVFLAPALDSASQLKLTEVKEKMGLLEVSLEQEIARSAARGTADVDGSADGGGVGPAAGGDPDEDNLEPTPTALTDVVFDDDDPDNDFYDLGFTLGKLRLSDRVGGFFRPTMVQELGSLLSVHGSQDTAPPGLVIRRPANFIGPGEEFLSPSSDFFLSSGRLGMSLIHFLPARAAADRLLQQYWFAVHPVCRLMHRPSFEIQYASFWEDISLGIEPIASLQALVFAMLFSAAVSVDKETCIDTYGTSKPDLVKNLQQATEMALARAKFLRSTRLQTLQAFVMYLTPMCRDQVSRAQCALVASAVRLAENMSLHRDGARYGLRPIETHVRRLIWWQILWLDFRCCELRGPRLIVREDDFDTNVPVNRNDESLTDQTPLSVPGVVDRWTDMVPTLLKIDCLEVHRAVWFDRPRIDKKQKTLTEVMIAIENQRRRIYAKYMPILGDASPIQQLTKMLLEMHQTKWHIGILHRFHHNVSKQMPTRLRQIMINGARAQIEVAVNLHSSQVTKPWLWYMNAHIGWQIAFLLLVDYYADPDWEAPERTWRYLDYVFELPPTNMPLSTKTRLLVMEVWDRMRIYREDRKIRPPTDAFKAIKLQAESRGSHGQRGKPAAGEGSGDYRGQSSSPEQAGSSAGGGGGNAAVSPSNLLHPHSPESYEGTSPGGSMYASVSPASSSAAAAAQQQQQQQQLPQRQQQVGDSMNNYFASGGDFGSAPVMTSPGSSALGDFEMPDIDWNEWDKLFPSVNYDMTSGASTSLNSFGYVVN